MRESQTWDWVAPWTKVASVGEDANTTIFQIGDVDDQLFWPGVTSNARAYLNVVSITLTQVIFSVVFIDLALEKYLIALLQNVNRRTKKRTDAEFTNLFRAHCCSGFRYVR